MTLTWKKWLCFLLITAVLYVGCEFYMARYLIQWKGFSSIWQANVSAALGNSPDWDYDHSTWSDRENWPWYHDLVACLTEDIVLPSAPSWPFGSEEPADRLATFDPDNPQTTDPQTILGLALLPDPQSWHPKYGHGTDKLGDLLEWWSQLRRLVELAMSLALDLQARQDFERLVLLVESNAQEYSAAKEWMTAVLYTAGLLATTQPAEDSDVLEQVYEDYLQAKAEAVDPNNAYYAWRRIDRQLKETVKEKEPADDHTEDSLPSEYLARQYYLPKPKELVAAAHQIDQVLTQIERNCTFKTHRGLVLQIRDTSYHFRWGHAVPTDLLQRYGSDYAGSVAHSLLYSILNRACFLGDELARRSGDRLALRMYQCAYSIAEQILLVEAAEAYWSNTVSAGTGVKRAARHLIEFWTVRSNAAKVLALANFLRSSDGVVREKYLAWYENAPTEVSGPDDPLYLQRYVRSIVLVNWLGASVGLLLPVSLASAVLYLLLRRWRNRGERSLSLAGKILWPAMIAGYGIMVLVPLGILIPTQVSDSQKAVVLLAWALVFSLAWLAVLGWMSRRTQSGVEGVRAMPTGWVFALSALAIVGAAIVAALVADDPGPAAAMVTGGAILAGLLLWFVVIIVTWFIRRTPADRAYRARVTKTFAVLTVLAGCLAQVLLAGFLPLTRHYQNKYVQRTKANERNEVSLIFGEDWPESFRPVSEEVFTLDEPTTQPTRPATDQPAE